MMIAHGLNKVRGPGGLDGTARYFESLGLRPAWVHARVAASTEIGSGVLIVLGAATPLASAGVIGVMTVAAGTDHKGKGFFIFKGGWEYVAVVGAATAALTALGPGRFSVDGRRGRASGGVGNVVLSVGLGVGSALAMLRSIRPPDAVDPSADRPADG
jgi:putative oxidoreductase